MTDYSAVLAEYNDGCDEWDVEKFIAVRDKCRSAAEPLVAAFKAGIESAGFVAVSASAELSSHRLLVRAVAACPCGKGRSYFYQPLGLGMGEEVLFHSGRQLGLQHIETDRAEGRWVDA